MNPDAEAHLRVSQLKRSLVQAKIAALENSSYIDDLVEARPLAEVQTQLTGPPMRLSPHQVSAVLEMKWWERGPERLAELRLELEQLK